MVLALGTAQLGLAYGVNNNRGVLTDEQAKELLDAAHGAGFTMLDTSSTYGLAEERIGAYLRSHFDAFTVMARNQHGYVSVYTKDEADALDGGSYQCIQMPGSILDGRMDWEIARQQNMGKKVLVRSLLLQGLLAWPEGRELSGNLGNAEFVEAAKPVLDRLREIGVRYHMSVVEMAVRWAWHLSPDVAIFGAESPEQVRDIGKYFRRGGLPYMMVNEVLAFRTNVPGIVISPRQWGQQYAFTVRADD